MLNRPHPLEREFELVNDLVDRLSEAQLAASGPEQFRARLRSYLAESRELEFLEPPGRLEPPRVRLKRCN
jgi:hypothetical protein